MLYTMYDIQGYDILKMNGKLYNVKEEVNSGLGDLFIEVDMLVYIVC